MKRIRKPSRNTLMQMFGSDEPIGYEEECKLNDDLINAQTLEEALRAILQYAENLHKVQRGYQDISPYGGEDIIVQGIDEIALSKEELLNIKFPRIEAQVQIAKALKQAGYNLSSFEEIVEQYEYMSNAGKVLTKQWSDYNAQVKQIKERLDEYWFTYSDNMNENVEPLYLMIKELSDEKCKLRRKSPISLLKKRFLTDKIEQLQARKEKLERLYKTEYDNSTRDLEKEYHYVMLEYPSIVFPGEEEPHMLGCYEEVQDAIKKMQTYSKIPEVYEEYVKAATVLKSVEKYN